MNLQIFEQKIKTLSDQVTSKKALYNDRLEQLTRVKREVEETQKNIDLYKKTTEFLTKFCSSSRDVVKQKIENLVTHTLQKVLQHTRYSFHITFQQKRNTTEALFLLYDEKEKQEIDIINSSGGGIADIVSTILLFTFLEMCNTKSDFVIFDEVGKHISADKRDEFFNLLKVLSHEYKKQIIFVTHQAEALNIAENTVKLTTGQDGFVQIGD